MSKKLSVEIILPPARPNYQLSILNYQLKKGLYVEKTLCRNNSSPRQA